MLAVSFLLLVGILLACRLLLPGLVEKLAVEALAEKQVTVRALPVGKVGFQGMDLQSGSIEYYGIPLSWQAIEVYYQPLALLNGTVTRVRIDTPVLGLDVDKLPRTKLQTPRMTSIEAVDTDVDGETIEEGKAPSSGREAGTILQTDSATGEDAGSVQGLAAEERSREDRYNPWDVSPIFEQVSAFPVSDFEIHDGQIQLHGLEKDGIAIGFDGAFWRSDDFLTGELNFSGNGVDGNMQLDGMKTSRFLSIRTGIDVETGRLLPILYSLLERTTGYDGHPLVVYPDQLSLDMLMETIPGNEFAVSGEVSLGKTAALFPEYGTYLQIDSFDLAASLGSGGPYFSAGLRMGRSRIREVEMDPFGIAATLDQEGSLMIESETIASRFKDWSFKSAFRGTARFSDGVVLDDARLEWSIGEILAEGMQIDAFSALVKSRGKALQVELSPVGLRRNGTLWVEQLRFDWDMFSNTGSGSLEWYDTIGVHAGSVKASISSGQEYPVLVDLSLVENSGTSALRVRYGDGDKGNLVEAFGYLSAEWINTISSWWGNALPGRFEGKGLGLEASLSGQESRYFGDVRLEFPDCRFESSTGISLEGIQGEVSLEVNILPKTPELQELRIQSIRFNEIELKNCLLEWEWLLLHRLEVKRLLADLGKGRVWIEPFSFNPLNPEIRTRLMFSGIEAEQLMELLDEKRFSVEGTFSGSLEVGWKNDEVLLGEGAFRIDPSDTISRFRFLDPGFVDEHLSNLGSAPEELKDRFREALLKEGIRLDQLEVTFRSVEESDQVMLRFEMSGETKTDLLEIPIKGIVINNLISGRDLAELLSMLGSVRMMDGS